MLGAGGNPGLLEPGVAVAVAAGLNGGQGGHAPLEVLAPGGVGHLAHDPCAVGHEDRLVVQNELLVHLEVLVVGLGGGHGVGVGGQLLNDLKALLRLGGIPHALGVGGGGVKELGAAHRVHQSVQESVEVAGGGISKEVDALGHGLVAQLPHLVPGGGNLPPLLLKEAGVVEQAAGGVEHGGQIGLAVAVGVGEGGVGKTAGDLVGDLHVLAGHGHAQHVGDFGDLVVLDELVGQALLTAGGQMDHVGILSALHGGPDDVLQTLVGGELHLDAGLGGEGVTDLLPHAGIGILVAGGQGGHADGHVAGGVVGGGLRGLAGLGHRGAGAGSGGSLAAVVGAAGEQGRGQGKRQPQGQDLLQFHFRYLLKF